MHILIFLKEKQKSEENAINFIISMESRRNITKMINILIFKGKKQNYEENMIKFQISEENLIDLKK